MWGGGGHVYIGGKGTEAYKNFYVHTNWWCSVVTSKASQRTSRNRDVTSVESDHGSIVTPIP